MSVTQALGPWLWVAVAAVVILIIGIILLASGRARAKPRTNALRRHFGPEYDRVVQEHGGKRKGEAELRARLRRRRSLTTRSLGQDERKEFLDAWESAQMTFVDKPSTGLREGDLLVLQVMRERGYPVEHFEERAKMISVDYPELVGHFRQAHTVAVANEEDSAETEDLRQAMVGYRQLFDELLEGGEPDRTRRI